MHTVVFQLHDNEYGFDVATVAEVVRMVALTMLPDAPDWLAGVVNLRGHVIPVMDLRRWLHLPAAAPEINTPILIVRVEGQHFGVIADELVEVIDLPDAIIQKATAPDGTLSAVHQMARLDHRVILLLDPSKLSAAIPVIR